MKILIMGLPTTGKTTLATELRSRLNAIHFNADEIRANIWTDLTFSEEDRLIHATRMGKLCDIATSQGFNVIADFVCPTEQARINFGSSIIIWMNRTTSTSYVNTDNIFQAPAVYDLQITDGMTVEEEVVAVLDKLITLNVY